MGARRSLKHAASRDQAKGQADPQHSTSRLPRNMALKAVRHVLNLTAHRQASRRYTCANGARFHTLSFALGSG